MEQNQPKDELKESKSLSLDFKEESYVDHYKLVLKNLESLYLNSEFSDLTFVIEDNEVPAHKVILAASSDYFRALLFGGLQESKSNKINLKCDNLDLFKLLLKYVYTGQMNLIDLSVKDILTIFQMSHEYNFKTLNEKISNYLILILSLDNVCIFYDLSNFYEIEELKTACIKFLELNAEKVLKEETFLRFSKANLKSILLRDSFCAKESDILIAVNKWIEANPDENGKDLYQLIRMNLIDLEQLIELIRPSEFLSSDEILDLVHSTVKNKNKAYRCLTVPEVNIACEKYESKIIHGELELLNDFNSRNRNDDGEIEHHEIVSNLVKPEEESCILIQFKYPYKINLIKINQNHKDDRTFSYYIETSLDAENWNRVIDHTAYICRAKQFLYFHPQVVKYVKIVNTTCSDCDHLEVTSIECLYTKQTFEIVKGLIKPNTNVATIDKSAQVIEGVSRIKDVLLFNDSFQCEPDISFTCHQITNRPFSPGNGSITVQLAQPYLIDSCRFLLYDSDKKKYSYEVYVSCNKKNWIKVATETKKTCKSWQVIKFEPLPVVFIAIYGTYCSSNQALNLLKFECPSSV